MIGVRNERMELEEKFRNNKELIDLHRRGQ